MLRNRVNKWMGTARTTRGGSGFIGLEQANFRSTAVTSRHVPLFCQVSPYAIHVLLAYIAHLLVTLCMWCCCNSKVLQVIEHTLAQSHQCVSG